MKLSPGQLFAKPSAEPFRPGGFFPMFNRAWALQCATVGEHSIKDSAAKDAFRHELVEAVGFSSLTLVDRTNGYDALMQLTAQYANDARAAAYFAEGAERRYRQSLIPNALAEISALEMRACGWNYAAEICRHMHLPLSLEECPAEFLAKVFIALDLQRRRLRKRSHQEAA